MRHDSDRPYRPNFSGPWTGWELFLPFAWWVPTLVCGIVLAMLEPGPAWLVIGLGVLGTLVLGAVGYITGRTPAEYMHWAPAAHLGVTGLASGAWMTGAAAGGLWTATAWILWAVFAFLGAGLWPSTRSAQVNHLRKLRNSRTSETTRPGEAPSRPRSREEIWELALAQAGAPGMRVKKESVTDSGLMLHLVLPLSGVTFKSFSQTTDTLEMAIARTLKRPLRPNALRITRARDQRTGQQITTEVYLYIDIEDILANNLPLPEDHTPLSIYDAFTLGKLIDGTPLRFPIASIHMLIAGQTRKGKSNFYHVLLSLLTRCDDVVVWAYDGKVSLIQPWIQPYINREIDPATHEPLGWSVIDWVAVDRIEFERMLLAAIAAIKARAGLRSQPQHAEANGGDKWVASPRYPFIFILADEISEAAGAHVGPNLSSSDEGASSGEIGKLLTRVQVLGAGEGVQVAVAAQRATVTMLGPGDGKGQLSGKFCFPLGGGMSNTGDVFEGDPEASQMAVSLTHPGSVVITGFGFETPQLAKIFLAGDKKTLQANIRNMVLQHAQLCGQLDAGTAAAIEKFGYSTRWNDPDHDRIYWAYGREMPSTLRRYGSKAPSAAASNVYPINGASSIAKNFGVEGIPSPFATAAASGAPAADDADWARIEHEYAEDLAEMARNAVVGVLPPTSGLGGVTPLQRAEPSAEDGYAKFLTIVEAAGTNGITGAEANRQLGELAPLDRKTIYTWRDRGVRERRIVVPGGKTMYSPANWAMLTNEHREAA